MTYILAAALAVWLCIAPALAQSGAGLQIAPPGVSCTVANNCVPASGGTYPNGFTVTGSLYYAQQPQYGACVWGTGAGNDAGPCINAAITAAAAAGGGTVVLPAGTFNVATQIINGTSGVKLAGAGVGYMRDSNTPNAFVSVTKLTWTGAAAATEFIETPSGNRSLYAVDVTGIVFDCASLASICAEFQQVNTSRIDIGVSEPRSIGVWFTTMPSSFLDGPGTELNDIWVQARSTSAVYSPTGVLFDGNSTGTFDPSANHIHFLTVWYAKGDGVVFGYSDNNYIENIEAYGDPTNQGGTPTVFADSTYVQKNGLQVAGFANVPTVFKMETSGIVGGFQQGSTITQGTHTGTEAITTYSLTTNGSTSAPNGTVLNFASTGSNVVAGLTASCTPSWACGLAPFTPVASVGATTVTLGANVQGAVANTTAISFSYGITQYAVTGSYTLTWTGATTANLTAPAGGHTQSGVTLTNGTLTFIDMVLPFSGTPANNDTYTIAVPTPARNILMQNLDKANSIPNPLFELGTQSFLTTSTAPIGTNFTTTIITPTTPSLTWVAPANATQMRVVVAGQGGCGGGGGSNTTPFTGAGGGGGGGGAVVDTGWFPVISGTWTAAFGTSCAGGAGATAGGNGTNGGASSAGAFAQFANAAVPTITAHGGGYGTGAAGGATDTLTVGGGGSGTIAGGNGSSGGGIGGAAGGSGATAADTNLPVAGGGGGGGLANGSAGAGGHTANGGAGGGSGGGCVTGTGQTSGAGGVAGGNSIIAGVTQGLAGTAGTALFGGLGGAGAAGGAGTSSGIGGAGGVGGAGGGGGGGGGASCNTLAGGVGGTGGTAEVVVMTQ